MLNCAAEKVIVNGFIKHKWMTKFHLIAPKVEMIQIIQKIEIFEQHSYLDQTCFSFCCVVNIIIFFSPWKKPRGEVDGLE